MSIKTPVEQVGSSRNNRKVIGIAGNAFEFKAVQGTVGFILGGGGEETDTRLTVGGTI